MTTLATTPTETLKNNVMAVYSQALGVLQATMADAANCPKEAFQAAKLIVQKVNLKVFFPSTSGKAQPAEAQPASGQSDAEVMDELVALDKQLLRMLGGGDGGPKRKKKAPRIDPFSALR